MLSTYLKLYGTAFFWGGTFIAGRLLAGQVAPLNAALLRFAIAASLLFLLTLRREGRLPRLSPRQLLSVLLLGLTGIFAYNLFFFHGLQSIQAGRAALIIALNPVVITLCAALCFGETLSVTRVSGVILSLLGAAIVISRGNPGLILAGGIGQGEWLILGCVASWSLYSLLGKTTMHGMTPLAAVTCSSIAGAGLLLVPALFSGRLFEIVSIPASGWLSIGYLGVFGTVVGFLWYFEGIQRIGASRAAIFINFVPINGVLLALLILHEPLTLALLFGGILVVTGSWLTNRPVRKP
ncbi:MAG TPA: DMT family transporter [Geothermobacteraceae bacterium]|nr:DMT family transporter [Geothermobacteraceae bacterium]